MTTRNIILSKITKHFRLISILIDFIILNFCFFISFELFSLKETSIVGTSNDLVPFILYSNFIWILLIKVFDAYSILRFETADKILSRSLKMLFSYLIILYLDVLFFRYIEISFFFLVIYSCFFGLLLVIFRFFSIKYLKILRRKGLNNRKIIFIGVNRNSLELAKTLNKEISFGYQLIGFFSNKHAEYPGITILGKISEVMDYCDKNKIDEIYYSVIKLDPKEIKKIINYSEKNFIRFKIIPDFNQYTLNRRLNIDFYKDIPILHLRKEPLESPFNKLTKRLFDLFFSSCVIVFIYPWLFPIVFFIQKLTSKGPVFFVQQRSGQDNIAFNCYKFRTMEENEESTTKGTIKNDPRITPFGKILRKSRIDELPQFINVIVGQMSIVGPRPHMLKHTEEYSKLIDDFFVRHYIKPGITGWAQTKGYLNENEKLLEMKDKVKKDVWYIENWSFTLDLRIILITALNIIRKDKNAY